MDLGLSIRSTVSIFVVDGSDDPEEDPFMTWLASGSVNAHRVVKFLDMGRVAYCDANELLDQQLVLGISLTAAADGQPVTVQRFDKMTEPSWFWIPGLPIYCGPLGVLTQTHNPSWPSVRVVAVAIDSTSIWIRVQPAIVQV